MDVQPGSFQHQGAYFDYHHVECRPVTLLVIFSFSSHIAQVSFAQGTAYSTFGMRREFNRVRTRFHQFDRSRVSKRLLQSRLWLGLCCTFHSLHSNDWLWACWHLSSILGLSCCHGLAHCASELCSISRSSQQDEARSCEGQWLDHLQVPMVSLCVLWILCLVLVPRFHLARLIRFRLCNMDIPKERSRQSAFRRLLRPFIAPNYL